jgi:hypothetical protein
LIDVSASIDAYFEEIVRDAMRVHGVEATGAAQHYLVGLLAEFARGSQNKPTLDKPFTFQLRDALEKRGQERFEHLRSIGDQVLYVLGFFGRAVKRRGADPEYVMSVGSSAYGHASAMMRMCGTAVGHDVLSELSSGYDRFVAVMSDVADCAHSAGGDDASVLRLYERWQATGSPRLAETLNELGLFPVRGGKDLH